MMNKKLKEPIILSSRSVERRLLPFWSCVRSRVTHSCHHHRMFILLRTKWRVILWFDCFVSFVQNWTFSLMWWKMLALCLTSYTRCGYSRSELTDSNYNGAYVIEYEFLLFYIPHLMLRCSTVKLQMLILWSPKFNNLNVELKGFIH